MMLPLVDGLFPAMILSGKLNSVVGILEVGFLVFGGSATLAVILAEMEGDRRDHVRVVLGIGAVLVTAAMVEAALAESIASALDLVIFERFAALVILAVAARTASARLADVLPHPGIIAVLGLVASLDPAGATLSASLDPELLARAGAAAGLGVAFALSVALAGPWLRHAVDIDRFRFGSAVALGTLALSIVGVVPPNAPLALAVLVVTGLLAFDPTRATEPAWEYEPDPIDITAAMADGGPLEDSSAEADAEDAGVRSDTERLPWL